MAPASSTSSSPMKARGSQATASSASSSPVKKVREQAAMTLPMPAAGLPSSACSSPRKSMTARGEAPALSPGSGRAAATLAGSFEGRFGSQLFGDLSPTAGSSTPTPRASKKPGVTTFTDPMNPFGRTAGKQMSCLQEARADASRAGGRTRNLGTVPLDPLATERRMEEAAVGGVLREKLIPRAYGADYKPGKAGATCTVSGQRSPRGVTSEGVSEALGTTVGCAGWAPAEQKQKGCSAVLGNYLNDMKRVGRSRRSVAADPSTHLQRMNDTRVLLPAQLKEGVPSDAPWPRRAASCEPTTGTTRSSSIRRYTASAESDNEDNYGFTRKRPVSVRAARPSDPTMLHHHEEKSVKQVV